MDDNKLKKINIAVVIAWLGPYGPANIVYNIIKYLDKNIYNITIITLYKKNSNLDKNVEKYDGEKRFLDLGVKIINLNSSRLKILFGRNKNFFKVVEENEIQLVHSHCVLSTFLISKIKKIKKIATIHCNPRENFKLEKGKCIGKYMEILFFKSLKKVDKRICCGKGIKNEIGKYSSLYLNAIENGIDLEIYTRELKKEEVKKKLNLEKDIKYIVWVGRFSELKNPYFVAKVFHKMRLENYKMIFLGSGHNNDIEKNKIEALNNKNIILPGRVNNVKEYLNACDYFISSSYFEGLPNSVLEACALELPIILSDIPPHREILEVNNKAGFLYEVDNEKDLEDKINKLINCNYDEYSKHSLSIVKNKLNSENMSKQYSDMYQNILGEIK